MEQKLELSKRAFWDVDFTKLDYDENKLFIIPKVFDRGSWTDMQWAFDYYGEVAVVEALKNTVYLRDDTINLVCVLFKSKPEDFKCYIRKQQRPIPGGY